MDTWVSRVVGWCGKGRRVRGGSGFRLEIYMNLDIMLRGESGKGKVNDGIANALTPTAEHTDYARLCKNED